MQIDKLADGKLLIYGKKKKYFAYIACAVLGLHKTHTHL
jgi:hypothetical protein